MEYSPQQDNIDKQPVSFLLLLRHSKVYSVSSLQKTLNLEHNKIESELSQSSMPIIENKTPILSTISHLQTVSVYLVHSYQSSILSHLSSFCLFFLVRTIVFTDIH